MNAEHLATAFDLQTWPATAYDPASFEQALAVIPSGYSEGMFGGRRWGVTLKRQPDGRRVWLYAEDLAAGDVVSFNLYRLQSGRPALKPCEMSTDKILAFVHGYSATRAFST